MDDNTVYNGHFEEWIKTRRSVSVERSDPDMKPQVTEQTVITVTV